MVAMEILDHHVIYANPEPSAQGRQGYFAGLVKLASGDLLGLFMMAESMDSTDGTSMVTRSSDQGRTWHLQGPLHEKEPDHRHDSDNMKPLLLRDGTLIATGYRFHRSGPDELISNPQTDGVRDGDNLFAQSSDEGRTWSRPSVIPRTYRELIETSGPAIELRNGTILVAGSLFPMWDGTHPAGCRGVLLRSLDKAKCWDDQTTFFHDPAGHYMPSEPRLCEMQEGRMVALFWMHDHHGGQNLTNHLTVSHDAGQTWSEPIDTGVWGQASNLLHWEEDVLLTIHSQRERDIGLYVRLVDFSNDEWRTIKEVNTWGAAAASRVSAYATMHRDLKFGQPSLLRLDNGEVLATHWGVVQGQSGILTHRLRINV